MSFGFFEEGDDLVATDDREALKEVVDRFAPFQSIRSMSEPATGASEHRSNSQHIRKRGDEGCRVAMVNKNNGHRLIYKRLADC